MVCALAGPLTLIEDCETSLRDDGILSAIERHNSPKLFNWLLSAFSYQGISDAVADSYIAQYGNASWRQIGSRLGQGTCPKLKSYWQYADCGYQKHADCCSESQHLSACPVPTHRLRNGRLNQTAYSFYLFVRDIAENDLIGWIGERLTHSHGDNAATSLVEPLRNIFGVSDKILTMSLSGLLLGARPVHPHWFDVGKNMIVVDTLVHNFLHRTGILDCCGRRHAYGPACYACGGCADIIRGLSSEIDARTFNASFPQDFPRFIQKAIWQYCAASHLDICTGNRIDDRRRCSLAYCQLFGACRRKPLKPLEKARFSAS